MRFFEVKVRYDRTNENGVIKAVNEICAVKASTFTEAEARAIQGMRPYVSGDFEVIGEKIAPYDEILPWQGGYADLRFYEIRYAVVSLDEVTAKESREPRCVLAEAPDIQSATDSFHERIDGTVSDLELTSVKETKIVHTA